MASMADLDEFPQFDDQFPRLNPSEIDLFSNGGGGCFASGLDLDLDLDMDMDFSVDDLLLADEGEGPDPDPNPNPPSPESADSSSSSSSSAVINHEDAVKDRESGLKRKKIGGDDVIPSPRTEILRCSGEADSAKRKIERDDVIPDRRTVGLCCFEEANSVKEKNERDDVITSTTPSPSPNSNSDPRIDKFCCADKVHSAKRKMGRDDVVIGTNSSPNPNPSSRTYKSKRKIERDDVTISPNPSPNFGSDKSHSSIDEANSESTFTLGGEEDEKKRTRLMRNRESAQLSRQRKKHYVEELEDKVRLMNSTIVELNGKISFYMSENARLHHQLTRNPANPPPPAAPAAFPPPPMHFPWIPYAGYHHPMRPNGAHVPLVPIPRLKPQQPAPAPKSKKAESKRSGDGKSRTKKAAGISLLGFFFLFLVFGGVVNLGLGGSRDVGKGRVLSVSGRNNRSNSTDDIGLSNGKMRSEANRYSSESIPALLYVPRNGKRVEINGNLIIHSVLASERAVAEAKSGEKAKQSSGLAIPATVASALAVPISERDLGRHTMAYRNGAEHVRALPSDPRDALKSTPADGPLQQWFREGLAGPILSSGTCSEVFQFDVSPSSADPSGGMVPATSIINATDTAPPSKMKNRRILYPHPIPLARSATTINDTQHFGKPSEKEKNNFHANSTVPSMVVSVMADPREAGDSNGDGMITPKSLSRIFVVVLMDSVKYVTYSCMLPLKSYGPHLVN